QLQCRIQKLSRISVIIDDQYPKARQGRRFADALLVSTGGFLLGPAGGIAGRWQRNGKDRAPASSLASRLHLPALRFDQMPNNGKPQAEAPVFSRGRAIGLPESIEYVGQLLRRYSLAAIGDDDLALGANLLETDFNLTAQSAELNCVRQQIPYHLLQTSGI